MPQSGAPANSNAFRVLITTTIRLASLTVPSYSGGRHPLAIAEQLPLAIGIDTNTGWPFMNSLVASSYSNFTGGDPVGCNRSLNHFVDLYTHRQLALCNKRMGVRCQHYWPINQSDFRPMKFHRVQVILYTRPSSSRFFSNFHFKSGRRVWD